MSGFSYSLMKRSSALPDTLAKTLCLFRGHKAIECGLRVGVGEVHERFGDRTRGTRRSLASGVGNQWDRSFVFQQSEPLGGLRRNQIVGRSKGSAQQRDGPGIFGLTEESDITGINDHRVLQGR